MPDRSAGRLKAGEAKAISGECLTMSASARRSLATEVAIARNGRPTGAGQAASDLAEKAGLAAGGLPKAKLSVFVAADNRLLREALGHMLAKKGNIEVTAWSRLCHCGRNR